MGLCSESSTRRQGMHRADMAQIVIENWRRHYNTMRPHSSPGYRPLAAPEVIVWRTPKEIVRIQSLN
ncbi:MAG: integrase core domain-containing protein [Afipia sp.]|nr:integrase core domain-containing protein [Afipia sp.]